MARREKILLSWSGGKDSAVSLFECKSPEFDIVGLLTILIEPDLRVESRATRVELIEAQAQSLEVPLVRVVLSPHYSAEEYEKKCTEALSPYLKKNLRGIAFGDIFHEEEKTKREKLMNKMGLRAVYPLWQWKPEVVLKAFFGLNYKAVVTSVDTRKLPVTFVGRDFNKAFVNDLPSSIDPCGENGEFKTFVTDGPFFQRTIGVSPGQVIEKPPFALQDLVLKDASRSIDNKSRAN